MKRKNYIWIMALAFVLVQCTEGKKKEMNKTAPVEQTEEIKLYKVTEVPFTENKNYKLKKEVKTNGVQHVKITTKAHFDRLFDSSKHTKLGEEVDFSTSFVLALVGIPSTLETSFSITSLKEKDDFIELTYCVEEEEKELAQAVYPCAILVVDKKFNKDIRFLIE
ncbi:MULTISPECIES: hypothetical protein [unclassified Myroides]|uniref:hypothetical protein n=1 Tax=unclassified Myroides TaxID=2642485 RepID=UPI003D2F67CC